MQQPERLRPLALITGASSGIGFYLAREFVLNGDDLVIAASHREKLHEAARALNAMDELPNVQAVTVDLSTSRGVEWLYEEVKREGRPVNVLAANAGVGVTGDFARETDLQAELRLIQLNVTSQVHLVKLFVRDMVARREGKILITSSIASLMPGPYYAVYAASKAFLRSFGQAIRTELEGTGVSVTVLMPGPTDTQFFERAQMLDSRAAQGPKQHPAEVAYAAVRALEDGADHVVPGVMNKLQAGMGKLMPDRAGAWIQGTQTKPQH
jgi:short-subunit dehydrogenase